MPKSLPPRNPSHENAIAEVQLLRDALGMRVDRPIVEDVANLRTWGLQTSSSCAGHADRPATGGPYIMVTCPDAQRRAKDLSSLPDGPTRWQVQRRCRRVLLREAWRLCQALERFQSANVRGTSSELLEVRTIGHHTYLLGFVHAEFSSLQSYEERRHLLERRRERLRAFTTWLASTDLPGAA